MNRLAMSALLLASNAGAQALPAFEFPANPLRAIAVEIPAGAVVGASALRPIPVFDRATLSSRVVADVAKRRAASEFDMADPNVVRFSIPKTKALASSIVAKLLDGSRLTAGGMIVRVNDSSWGETGASMSAGILTVEPELIAIMSSEDEVAAVVAHEIVHYLRAHDEQLVASRPRNWNPFVGRGGDLFDAPPQPSRKEIEARWKHELEADALSLRLLANAGYDPSAAIGALLVIQNERNTEPRYSFGRGRPDPLHPPVEARVEALRQVMARERMSTSTRVPGGLPEAYRELAGRRRSPKPDDVPASELYGHYKRPKSFVP